LFKSYELNKTDYHTGLGAEPSVPSSLIHLVSMVLAKSQDSIQSSPLLREARQALPGFFSFKFFLEIFLLILIDFESGKTPFSNGAIYC
jgi:hypothetical protein